MPYRKLKNFYKFFFFSKFQSSHLHEKEEEAHQKQKKGEERKMLENGRFLHEWKIVKGFGFFIYRFAVRLVSKWKRFRGLDPRSTTTLHCPRLGQEELHNFVARLWPFHRPCLVIERLQKEGKKCSLQVAQVSLRLSRASQWNLADIARFVFMPRSIGRYNRWKK